MIPAVVYVTGGGVAPMSPVESVLFLVMIACFAVVILAVIPLVIGITKERDRVVNWSFGFIIGASVFATLIFLVGLTGSILGWWTK